MGDKSKIEWTDATWNPVRACNLVTGGVGHFCEHVSEGCRHCYAERLQPRFGNPIRFAAQDRAKVDVFLDEDVLLAPLRWRRPRMIFVCSMSDLFGDWVPDEWLDKIFAVMAMTPQHTFQVLTKRPERMREYLDLAGARKNTAHCGLEQAAVRLTGSPCAAGLIDDADWPLPNVWLGVSAEDQAAADLRVPPLLATPAAVRFVSYEPALGPVDMTELRRHNPAGASWIDALRGLVTRGVLARSPSESSFNVSTEVPGELPALDWVICGGESGSGARPMHPDWARSMRDQCAAAGVPYFFKQWGEWILNGEAYRCGIVPIETHHPWGRCQPTMARVGKRRAGRHLDGVLHDAMPAPRGEERARIDVRARLRRGREQTSAGDAVAAS